MGHVGWAFLDDRAGARDFGLWLIGSVDNPPKTLLTAPEAKGFWQIEHRGDPLRVMHNRRYEHYKIDDARALQPR